MEKTVTRQQYAKQCEEYLQAPKRCSVIGDLFYDIGLNYFIIGDFPNIVNDRQELGTKYIRIKRVLPTKNIYIRLFRKLKRFFCWGQIPFLDCDPPNAIFQLLFGASLFPLSDCIFRHIKRCQKLGYSVQATQCPLKRNKTELHYRFYHKGIPTHRIELKLSLRENEASLSSSLIFEKSNHSLF